jgi:aspartyl-tRNA(Asn)/glutamyl-tRNA(Gln) amidotransferase subunit A
MEDSSATPCDICRLSAKDLGRLYRDRTLSPVEVAEATVARASALNPILHAFITLTPEVAIAQAKQAERELRRADAPALTGIPVSIKDLLPTKGIRTTRGSLIWKDWIPDFDAPIVERLHRAGAVLIGKTNTSEMGWKADTTNLLTKGAVNPWQEDRTAGGSSGGAAAAVAVGIGPIAQGSDGAGSIRIPASFCGVFGFKPTYGRLPVFPATTLDPLTHLGPITRTVDDAKLFLHATEGEDSRDRGSVMASQSQLSRADEGRVASMRCAWLASVGEIKAEPNVREVAEDAAEIFQEIASGVDAAALDLNRSLDILNVLWCTGQAAMHDHDWDQVATMVDPGRVEIIESGREYSGVEVALAHRERASLFQQLHEFMEQYDLLLTPTVPISAFPAGQPCPERVGGQPTGLLEWTPFTFPFNLTGQPAASVPCGFTAEGLPVGLQIVGRYGEDGAVLAAAAEFENRRPWLKEADSPPSRFL